jgi:hypothetical protein
LISEELENIQCISLKIKLQRHKKNIRQTIKQPDLPMYKPTEIQRPEPMIPPTSAVRMKHARQKKHEKSDKLMSKAFGTINSHYLLPLIF